MRELNEVLYQSCIRCNQGRRAFMGTLLCNSCFEKKANRLREKYRKYENTAEYNHWLKIAKRNDVSERTFKHRVIYQKMSYKDAATKPVRRGKHNARFNAFREKLKKYGLAAEYIEIYQLLVVDELSDEQALEKLREKHAV